jgi:hypothetical protein
VYDVAVNESTLGIWKSGNEGDKDFLYYQWEEGMRIAT